MNWEAIGAVGEVVGAAGVIASLVYLSIQIRQNTQSTMAATYQQATSGLRALSWGMASTPDLGLIFAKGRQGAPLTDEEAARFHWACLAAFRTYENIFYQYERGVLEERVWRGVQEAMVQMFWHPGVQDWWKPRRSLFDAAFRRLMDQSSPPDDSA